MPLPAHQTLLFKPPAPPQPSSCLYSVYSPGSCLVNTGVPSKAVRVAPLLKIKGPWLNSTHLWGWGGGKITGKLGTILYLAQKIYKHNKF